MQQAHISFPRQETIIKHRIGTHGQVITDRPWEQDGLLADITHHPSYGGHIERPDINAADRDLSSCGFVESLQEGQDTARTDSSKMSYFGLTVMSTGRDSPAFPAT